MQAPRDKWWTNVVKSPRPASHLVNAPSILFILYTSGSTGKPKGVQHHTTRGYLHVAILT